MHLCLVMANQQQTAQCSALGVKTAKTKKNVKIIIKQIKVVWRLGPNAMLDLALLMVLIAYPPCRLSALSVAKQKPTHSKPTRKRLNILPAYPPSRGYTVIIRA